MGTTTHGSHPADAGDPDDATRALAALADVLERSGAKLTALAARARELRAARLAGTTWRDLVPTEDRPLVVEAVTELLDRLADGGAAFRRAQARTLVDEGLSRRQVARLLGVTPQRISALLLPPPPPGARAAKRRHRPGGADEPAPASP